MPSTFTHAYEVCFPCKYHQQHLWKSGRNPVYHRYCTHPTFADRDVANIGHATGRFIGETDAQPHFCPLTPEETKAMNVELRAEGWLVDDE